MAIDLGDANPGRAYTIPHASLQMSGNFSWLFWMRIARDQTGNHGYILSDDTWDAASSFNAFYRTDDLVNIKLNDGTNSITLVSASFTDSNNRLLAVTYDGTTLRLFICQPGESPVLEDSDTATWNGYTETNDWQYGRRFGDAERYHNVLGDLLRTDDAVTEDEIGAIAGGVDPALVLGSRLVGWWNFYEPVATVKDLVGTSDATQVGTSWPAAVEHMPGNRGNAISIFPVAETTETERLAADALLAGGSNLEDTGGNNPPADTTDIDEDTASASDDGLWWTAVDVTAATDARVGFPTPSNTLTGTQTVNARVRKTDGNPDPLIDMVLFEDGAAVSTLLSGVSITADDPGQVVTGQFDASEITNAADVEIRIVSTPGKT